MQTNDKKNTVLYPNVIGGAVQATLVTIVGYPFDLVKVRLQSKMYPNSIQCVKGTVKNEGFLGLYRGSLMPWISHMVKRPIQYPVSEFLKQKMNNQNQNPMMNTISNYMIGGITGFMGPYLVPR